MNVPRSSWIGDRRGLAAIEFALVAPVLLALLGGTIDFGLVMSGKSQLANGIAQGVDYALLQGSSVTAASVKAMVQNGSSRSGLTPSVTVTITGPACYCVSGQPASLVTPSAALSPSYTCTGTCPSPAAAPGAFLTITASYVYQPLMPFYSQISNTTVSEKATVRLQ
jgi:Flp pilus assembly protein TadG